MVFCTMGNNVRLRIILTASLLAVGVGLYWIIQGPPEDVFKGVPVSVTFGITGDMSASLGAIARAHQFFLPRELVVTVKDYHTSKQCLDALAKGEIDLATTSETPLVLSAFERDDLRVIASIGSSENEAKILARVDRGIRVPGDLRGKHVGILEDSPFDFFLHLFLLKQGLTMSDVNVSLYPPDSLLDALDRGAVDAVSYKEPFISAEKIRLGDRVIVFAEPGFLRITQSVVGLEQYLEDHPVVVHKMLVALLDSETFIREKPDASIAIVARSLGADSLTIASMWPEFTFHVCLDQSLLIGMQDQAHWILEREEKGRDRIPDLFRLIAMKGLLAAKPERVSVIH